MAQGMHQPLEDHQQNFFLRRHRLTIDEFHKMGEANILPSEARVELIDGELIDMVPIGPDHAGTVNQLGRLLTFAVGEKALISIQNPVVLDDHHEPQPDIAVLKLRDDFYKRSHPRPEHILLLVEVADSSTRQDRNSKIPMYARAGIPGVWLVDILQNVIEIYRDPGPKGYQTLLRPADLGKIALKQFPNIQVDLSRIFS